MDTHTSMGMNVYVCAHVCALAAHALRATLALGCTYHAYHGKYSEPNTTWWPVVSSKHSKHSK